MKKSLFILGLIAGMVIFTSLPAFSAGACWCWNNDGEYACTDDVADEAACFDLGSVNGWDHCKFIEGGTCADKPPQDIPGVPSMTTYGIIALILVLAATGIYMYRRRRVTA